MTAPTIVQPADMPGMQHRILSGVAAYLILADAVKAAEFYTAAFAASEVHRLPPDEQGRTLHVHLHINGASVMLGDACPEYGVPLERPQACTLHLEVDDVEFWWQRAVAAGALVVMPLQDMFWGDRYGRLRDPFGVAWSLGAPIRTVDANDVVH